MQHVSGNTLTDDCLEQISAFAQENEHNRSRCVKLIADYLHRARNKRDIRDHSHYLHAKLQKLMEWGSNWH